MKKIEVLIPDLLFYSAERLAQRLRKSRSQLYGEAVADYVERHDLETLTDRIDAVCEDLDATSDPIVRAAARIALARSKW